MTPASDGPSPSEDPVYARRAEVIACQAAREASLRRQPYVLLTLSHEGGMIEQCAISREDATSLLRLLAAVLRLPKVTDPKAKKWVVPHSILRADLDVGNDLDGALLRLRQTMPQVAAHIEAEAKRLRRSLAVRGRNVARTDTIIRRFTRAILVAVAAASD